MLHITLIAISLYTYFIEVVCIGRRMVCLSAFSFLLHQGESTVEHIVRTLPLPAIL